MESIRARNTKVAGRTICRRVAREAQAEVPDDTHAQEGMQGVCVPIPCTHGARTFF